MPYESQEEADYFEAGRSEAARAEYDQHEKEGQLGEECCCDVHSSCSVHNEENKCVCGLEICLGGAEVELGGVCHRIGNHCYIIEPKISEEKKDWEKSFRRKWEGANTGGHNAISTPVMDEIIEDIREKLKEEREALLKEILEKVDDVDVVGNPEGELVVVEIQELIRKKMV